MIMKESSKKRLKMWVGGKSRHTVLPSRAVQVPGSPVTGLSFGANCVPRSDSWLIPCSLAAKTGMGGAPPPCTGEDTPLCPAVLGDTGV